MCGAAATVHSRGASLYGGHLRIPDLALAIKSCGRERLQTFRAAVDHCDAQCSGGVQQRTRTLSLGTRRARQQTAAAGYAVL